MSEYQPTTWCKHPIEDDQLIARMSVMSTDQSSV